MYQPQPLDTSSVVLSSEVLALAEQLARNAHDLWAQQRLAQGWTYGPHRDDSRKLHPCLIPYEQLPEAEKAYDRTISLGTLKAISALGYRIEPPPDGADEQAGSAPAEGRSSAILARLEAAPSDLGALLAIWNGRELEEWRQTRTLYERLAERLLGLGEPLLAYDVCNEGEQYWPNQPRLRQLQALALARSGATEAALQIASTLYDEGNVEEETVGLLARIYKDLALGTPDRALRQQHLAAAAALYEEAFERHGGYWTGINAATLAVLRGDRERGVTLARTVRGQCLPLVRNAAEPDYWAVATLGEAALILGDWNEAEQWYTKAAALGRQRLGDFASTRRNARLLLDHLPGERERIERALSMPRLAVFTGDMAHGPGSNLHRFSTQDEHAIRSAIREQLVEHDCLIGYSSAAPGTDILFLEAVLELGAEANVVLQYDQEAFLRSQAKQASNPAWSERVERVLQRAARVIVASPQSIPSGPATFEFANRVLRGLAANHAEHLETELIPLAFGTPHRAAAPAGSPYPTEIAAMLFGDAVHFSRLGEEQLIPFMEQFLGPIGRLVAASPHRPVMTNTWGDGLFFVFSTIRDAGLFALDLRDLVVGTDWSTAGLPEGLNLRIGVHAGPVYRCLDPITGRPNFLGTHVSRAARIEPITPPGHVYASESFAALATNERAREFVCDYVGQTPLAKAYGTFPTYHVRRR